MNRQDYSNLRELIILIVPTGSLSEFLKITKQAVSLPGEDFFTPQPEISVWLDHCELAVLVVSVSVSGPVKWDSKPYLLVLCATESHRAVMVPAQ